VQEKIIIEIPKQRKINHHYKKTHKKIMSSHCSKIKVRNKNEKNMKNMKIKSHILEPFKYKIIIKSISKNILRVWIVFERFTFSLFSYIDKLKKNIIFYLRMKKNFVPTGTLCEVLLSSSLVDNELGNTWVHLQV